jgi:integrase
VAKGNRHGHRDGTMMLIGFQHGLRVSELCDLQWSSIEFETATMHLRRAGGGQEATHPLLGDELRALRELKRQSASPFVFASERGGPVHFVGLRHHRLRRGCGMLHILGRLSLLLSFAALDAEAPPGRVNAQAFPGLFQGAIPYRDISREARRMCISAFLPAVIQRRQRERPA